MNIRRSCLKCGQVSGWTLRAGWQHIDERLTLDHVAVVAGPPPVGCCGRPDPYAAARLPAFEPPGDAA